MFSLLQVYPFVLNFFRSAFWGAVVSVFIIIIVLYFGARMFYLLQLFGFVRFFCRISNLLCFMLFMFGITSVIITSAHVFVDVIFNFDLYKRHEKFLNLYRPVLRERMCILTIGLFTVTAVVRALFSWYLSPNFDVIGRTLHYTFSIILVVLVIFFCFVIILYQQFPNLLQFPSFAAYTIALSYNFSFRQLTENTIFCNDRVLPFLICLTSSLVFVIIRLFIIFYYAVAKYNQHKNLFHIINKRHLGSLTIDLKYKSKCSYSSDNVEFVESAVFNNLDSTRIFEIKQAAMKAIKDTKEV